jgi:hypothetical protein
MMMLSNLRTAMLRLSAADRVVGRLTQARRLAHEALTLSPGAETTKGFQEYSVDERSEIYHGASVTRPRSDQGPLSESRPRSGLYDHEKRDDKKPFDGASGVERRGALASSAAARSDMNCEESLRRLLIHPMDADPLDTLLAPTADALVALIGEPGEPLTTVADRFCLDDRGECCIIRPTGKPCSVQRFPPGSSPGDFQCLNGNEDEATRKPPCTLHADVRPRWLKNQHVTKGNRAGVRES